MTGKTMFEYPQILAVLTTELSTFTKGRFEIGEDTNLVGELGLDSLQVMDLLLNVEDRFDISIPVSILPDVRTVRDLALQIANLTRER